MSSDQDTTVPINRYPFLVLKSSPEALEMAYNALWETEPLGVEERDSTTLIKGDGATGSTVLVAHYGAFRDAEAAMSQLQPAWEVALDAVVGDAWRDAWKAYFKPTRLGERIVVRPSWEPWTASATDVVITLDPGQAFGTGTHATTQLILKALDGMVRGGETVLDLGTGSGILAIAAIKLGAKSVVAVDVDPDAVAVARENAEINGVLDQIDLSTTPIDQLTGTYDLVLANIEARVHLAFVQVMIPRVAPGGFLLLSGVLTNQVDDIKVAFSAMDVHHVEHDGEWSLIVVKPRSL